MSEKVKLKKTKTCRGFARIDFTDTYGLPCSLQHSSSMEPRIWFGVDTKIGDNVSEPLIMTQHDGWKPLLAQDKQNKVFLHKDAQEDYMHKTVLFHDRMHLSREQVKKLLPHLQKFVKTGRI